MYNNIIIQYRSKKSLYSVSVLRLPIMRSSTVLAQYIERRCMCYVRTHGFFTYAYVHATYVLVRTQNAGAYLRVGGVID